MKTFALALLLLASQEGVPVEIETADSSKVRGTLETPSIKFKSDVGEVEIEAKKIRTLTFGDSDTLTTESTSLKGRLVTAELKVKTDFGTLTLSREKIKKITFNPGPVVAPPTKPPPRKDDPLPDNAVPPAAIVKLGACLPDLFLSPDKKWLYLLNVSDGKVQRVDMAKRALDAASANTMNGTEAACMTPDGAAIYTCASPDGHAWSNKKPNGKIQWFETATMKLKSTFAIEIDPVDIETDGKGHAFVSSGSQGQKAVCVVDISKQSIVARWGNDSCAPYLRMKPDGKRLYYGNQRVSPADFFAIVIPDDVDTDKVTSYDSPYHGEYSLGGPFQISPDGAYIVAATGAVLRLAKNRPDDMKYAGKLEPHNAAVFRGDSVWLVTQAGMLKCYSFPECELRESFVLGVDVYRMVVDADNGILVCAIDSQKKADGQQVVNGVGDLYFYDLKNLKK